MYLCYIHATKNYCIYCQLFYYLIIVDNLNSLSHAVAVIPSTTATTTTAI